MTLASLGLSGDQERVYLCLLRSPERDTGAVAKDVGLSPADVDQHVHALLDAGLLRRTADGPRPERPDLATAATLAHEQQEVTDRQERLVATRRRVNDLVELYVAGTRLGESLLDVERVEGFAAIRQRLDELTHAAQTEFCTVNSGVATPEELEQVRANDRPHLERGLRFRSIMPTAYLEQEYGLRNARQTSALGEQYRILPEPPLTFVVADGSVAVVPLDPDDVRRGALFLRAPGVVRAFSALFELAWSQARPVLSHVDGRVAPELDDRDRRLLELLAAGAQDETVARQLGLGLRTVRRDIARILSVLGARSRFEAGVLAGRRGWL